MRRVITPLLLVAASGAALAGEFSGAWISCDPEAPWRYTLLSVETEGAHYRWIAEWGSPYAANGAAELVKSDLVLRGCRSYQGETERGCDENNPPVFSRLREQDFRRVRDYFTSEDLRDGRWVRVPEGESWQKLAKKCEETVERLRPPGKARPK